MEEVEEGEMDEMRDEMEVGRVEPSSPARGATAVSPSFRPKTLSRLTPPSATANATWFSQGCGAGLKKKRLTREDGHSNVGEDLRASLDGVEVLGMRADLDPVENGDPAVHEMQRRYLLQHIKSKAVVSTLGASSTFDETHLRRVDGVQLNARWEVAEEVQGVDVDERDCSRSATVARGNRAVSTHSGQHDLERTHSLMMTKSWCPGVRDRFVSHPSPMSFLQK